MLSNQHQDRPAKAGKNQRLEKQMDGARRLRAAPGAQPEPGAGKGACGIMESRRRAHQRLGALGVVRRLRSWGPQGHPSEVLSVLGHCVGKTLESPRPCSHSCASVRFTG